MYHESTNTKLLLPLWSAVQTNDQNMEDIIKYSAAVSDVEGIALFGDGAVMNSGTEFWYWFWYRSGFHCWRWYKI